MRLNDDPRSVRSRRRDVQAGACDEVVDHLSQARIRSQEELHELDGVARSLGARVSMSREVSPELHDHGGQDPILPASLHLEFAGAALRLVDEIAGHQAHQDELRDRQADRGRELPRGALDH